MGDVADVPDGVTVRIVGPDPRWPAQFDTQASALRALLGSLARRIDHIGSTAVPGLAAKNVIDIQVSVADPTVLDDPDHPARRGLAAAGFDFAADNDDRRKRFFSRRRPGEVLINLHVRRDGCVSQQQALLLRDYLREHPAARQRYEREKRRLSRQRWRSVDDYADAKGDVVWELLRQADVWSWQGWTPGPSDA